jgi:HEAT repeat protein
VQRAFHASPIVLDTEIWRDRPSRELAPSLGYQLGCCIGGDIDIDAPWLGDPGQPPIREWAPYLIARQLKNDDRPVRVAARQACLQMGPETVAAVFSQLRSLHDTDSEWSEPAIHRTFAEMGFWTVRGAVPRLFEWVPPEVLMAWGDDAARDLAAKFRERGVPEDDYVGQRWLERAAAMVTSEGFHGPPVFTSPEVSQVLADAIYEACSQLEREPNYLERLSLARLLGAHPPEDLDEAARLWEALLSDASVEIRGRAIASAGSYVARIDERALLAKVEALPDDAPEVTHIARRIALARMFTTGLTQILASSPDAFKRAQAARELAELGRFEAIRQALAQTQDEELRWAFTCDLARSGDEKALAEVLTRLRASEEVDERSGAVRALGYCPAVSSLRPDIVRYLLAIVDDDDPDNGYREDAIAALARLKEKQLVPRLRKILAEPLPRVRDLAWDDVSLKEDAAAAAGELGDASLISALVQVACGEAPYWRDARLRAVDSILQIAGADGVRLVRRFINDEDPLVAAYVVRALAPYSDQVRPELEAAARSRAAVVAKEASKALLGPTEVEGVKAMDGR